jgi:hypothetical protein
MIHHMSFALPNPESAAPKLAALTGGVALRTPSPPFPRDAWFVVLGDDAGGMLELLPESFVLDPDAPLGLGRRKGAPDRGAAHVLVTSPLPVTDIVALAQAEGWRADVVESGLFEIVKVWVQGAFLVEFIARDNLDRYVDAFGSNGLATLDGKLRRLETDLAEKLSTKIPPAKLAEILGA